MNEVIIIKKYSEIAKDDIHLAGDKISLQDIVGKSIIITGYKIKKQLFKKYGDKHGRIYSTTPRTLSG